MGLQHILGTGDCLHRILLFLDNFILAILHVTNIVVALSCISLGVAYNSTGISGCDVTRFTRTVAAESWARQTARTNVGCLPPVP